VQTHEWQQIQAIITSHEQQMQERVGALRTADQRLKDLENNSVRLQEKSLNVNSELRIPAAGVSCQESGVSCVSCQLLVRDKLQTGVVEPVGSR